METGFQTFSEVIAFAVMREEEARQFYTRLAGLAEDAFMKKVFMDFAEEEEKHRHILQTLDAGGLERIFGNILEPVNNLHLAESEPGPHAAAEEMDFREALLLAIKREDKSHHLYSLLAEWSDDEEISLLFIGLAREEAHHRLRIERAYKALYRR